MARLFTPSEVRRYDAVRFDIKARMRATDRSTRITLTDIVGALGAAGYDRSPRYVRAVLNGEKRSRPALREISAAVDAVRRNMERGLPDWL
jgi:hypothetical protein